MGFSIGRFHRLTERLRRRFLPGFTFRLPRFTWAPLRMQPSCLQPNPWDSHDTAEYSMKTTKHVWIERFAIGAVVIALPLEVMAHVPAGDALESCQSLPYVGSPMALPSASMFPMSMRMNGGMQHHLI